MTKQIEASKNAVVRAREDAQALKDQARMYLKGGPAHIKLMADAAVKEAEANAMLAVLRERQHCVTILQNAFNVAQADYESACDDLRATGGIDLMGALAASMTRHRSIMLALQSARNAISDRGE